MLIPSTALFLYTGASGYYQTFDISEWRTSGRSELEAKKFVEERNQKNTILQDSINSCVRDYEDPLDDGSYSLTNIGPKLAEAYEMAGVNPNSIRLRPDYINGVTRIPRLSPGELIRVANDCRLDDF